MEKREQVLSRVKDEVAQKVSLCDYADLDIWTRGDISDEIAIRFNEEMEKQNGWISVKDRLPEDNERVLAIGIGTHAIPCKFRDNKFYRDVDLFSDDRIVTAYYTTITHWMPLPKPPQQ